MTIVRRIAMSAGFLVLSLLPFPLRAQAASSTPPNVLAEARQYIKTADFRATGRLVNLGADGSRSNYKIDIKGHWFPDGLRVLYVIRSPAPARVQLLLHMALNGATTIEVLRPSSATPSSLTSEHRRDSLLGTVFSYEDLVDSQLFWKNQKMLDPAKCGVRDCVVLNSVPAADDHSQYAFVTSWIDNNIFYPIHVVKTDRSTGEQRDFLYEGLRQTSGVWSANQIEVKVPGKLGSSLLIIERGSAKANLSRKDFALGQPFAEGDD
jgi:hypothetical protein